MKDLVFDLCSCTGISGDEKSVCEYCKRYLSNYTDNVEMDFNNNVKAVIGNENAGYTFLLDAHLDKIGFIVSDIDDNGFLRVDTVGGIDTRTLLDAPVIVNGNEQLKGVICCMPPHLSDGDENKAVETDKIWVDLGLPYKNVKEIVSIGDSVSFYVEPKSLINNRITASALDNRAGVAAVLKAAELLSKKNINSKVIILLSCQEETYAAGAKTLPFNYDIDESICVDLSFASQPGVESPYSDIKLGKGPMLCISPNLNREMYNKLKEICEDKSIPYQIEVCNGKTGTNADHITLSKSGIKSALISIPEKNMHTQAEIANLKDIENTVELIVNYIVKGGLYE